MECQSPARIRTLPAVKIRESRCSAYSFLPNRSPIHINLPSSRPSTMTGLNGTNGYHNGVGSAPDYFSPDPRLSQQSHLSSTRHIGSSQSTASPDVPHLSLYSPDDADPIYGWKQQPSLTKADSARPPLPPKIPSQPTQISHMPEPAMPVEDLYSPYLEPGKSNGAGASVNRNDSAGSYVLPPLPHPSYQPGQLVDPHTDSPSCKKLALSPRVHPFIFVPLFIQI